MRFSTQKVEVLCINQMFAIENGTKRVFEYHIFPHHLESSAFTPLAFISTFPEAFITGICAFVYAARVLESVRFQAGVVLGEDNIFSTQAVLSAKSLYIDSSIVYNYRQSATSATKSKQYANFANSHFAIAMYFNNLLNSADSSQSMLAQGLSNDLASNGAEALKSFCHYSLKRTIAQLLQNIQLAGYKKVSFSKSDLAPFLPYIRGKRLVCYHYPRIYGFPKRVKMWIKGIL